MRHGWYKCYGFKGLVLIDDRTYPDWTNPGQTRKLGIDVDLVWFYSPELNSIHCRLATWGYLAFVRGLSLEDDLLEGII
jgi:hypothetical protein